MPKRVRQGAAYLNEVLMSAHGLGARNRTELPRRAATVAGKVLPVHLMRHDQPDHRISELSN